MFENKYLETLDWSKITEKQKDDYYFEFVMHYLPGSFIEQLGSPIQLVIGAIIGIIVGGALAELEAVLAVANGAMIAGETVVAIKGIYNAYIQRKSAKSIHELKESARTLADGVAKLTMQVINAILMFKASIKDRTPADSIQAKRDINTSNQKKITSEIFDSHGNLKPNIRYKAGEHSYYYETDEIGRITNCEAPELHLKTHKGRLNHNPNTPGKIDDTDHAGHIIADVFGGSPELDNLVSQDHLVNTVEYRSIERRWQQALNDNPPKQITELKIKLLYNGNDKRPCSFMIEYRLDGQKIKCSPISN